MNSGKVSSSLLSSLQSIIDTGRVDTRNVSQDDSELASDLKHLQAVKRNAVGLNPIDFCPN
jgi:hypothetical protein